MWSLFRRKHDEQVEDEGGQPSVGEVLLSGRPSDTLFSWAKSGYLRGVLPDLDALRGISQAPAHRDDAFIHTLKVIDAIEPQPIRRWAALLHDIAKAPTFIETPEGRSRFFDHDRIGAVMVPEIMSGAGAPEEMVEPVQRLVGLHMRPISYNPEWTDAAVRRLADEATEGRGEAGWADLLALARADLRGYLPEPIDRGLWVLDRLEERRRRIVAAESKAVEAGAPHSPLNGAEILELAGRDPGPWVGELKAYLQEQVEQGHLPQEDVAQARTLAREWLAQRGSDATG